MSLGPQASVFLAIVRARETYNGRTGPTIIDEESSRNMCNIFRRDIRIARSRKSLAFACLLPSFTAALFTMFTFTCMFTSNLESRRTSRFASVVCRMIARGSQLVVGRSCVVSCDPLPVMCIVYCMYRYSDTFERQGGAERRKGDSIYENFARLRGPEA